MPILILIKWPYCLLLIDYLKVSLKLMSTNKNVLSPLSHDPIADGSGNIAPHPHYSSTTHMDSQTLPTHSVPFLFLLIQTIFAMGRCCNPSTRPTRRSPLPIAPTATALPYTYPTSYPMLAFIYNIYYCHHQPVSLLLLPLQIGRASCRVRA